MSRFSLGWAALLAVTAAVGLPAVSSAQRATHKTIRFSVYLKGSQATTWHAEAHGSTAGCASSMIGDGEQMIRFSAPQPALISLTSDGRAAPEFNHGITVDADVERGAQYRERIPVVDPRTSTCRGTRELPPVQMPGCGERSGQITVRIGYTSASVGGDPPDDELVPLVPPHDLRFRGTQPDFDGGTLLDAYPQCPLQEPDMGYPASRGELFEALARLTEKRLLSVRTGGWIRVSASHIARFTLPGGGHGQTAVAYNLKLRAISVR